MKSFQFAHCPSLHFGPGKLAHLDTILSSHGFRNLAVITGSSSLRTSDRWVALKAMFTRNGRELSAFSLRGEPSPAFVDAVVDQLRENRPHVVIAIGGGSVVDAGKAVSAMLMEESSVGEFLEGVGTKKPSGHKLPFIAVPTTAGTGSEATKNAVLSSIGAEGFKKSLRHESYVPDLAIIDPELALSCPPEVTAACGMDAITQLLEAFVSVKANPLTDSLARSGLEAAGRSFTRAVEAGGTDMEARGEMSYASYLSGVALANAGLGVVHGIASPLGGHYPISHGVVCGTLVAEATRAIVARLEGEDGDVVLAKYAEAGAALTGVAGKTVKENCERLIETLTAWTGRFGLRRLGSYGLVEEDLRRVAVEADNKNGPVTLSSEEIYQVMLARR